VDSQLIMNTHVYILHTRDRHNTHAGAFLYLHKPPQLITAKLRLAETISYIKLGVLLKYYIRRFEKARTTKKLTYTCLVIIY